MSQTYYSKSSSDIKRKSEFFNYQSPEFNNNNQLNDIFQNDYCF
jgi:hypothetical protein